jgi:hypothetical protein
MRAVVRGLLSEVGLAIFPPIGWQIRIVAQRRCLGLLFCARLRACTPGDVGRLAPCAPSTSCHRAVIEPDDIAERVELQLRQLASIADPEIVKRQVCERDPLELVDLVAERLEHSMDLTMLAFMDRDPEPGVLALTGQDLDLGGHRDRAVVERDALAQRIDAVAVEPAVNLDVIRLGHVVAGREQARRELAVVGQEQHALGIEVEATDRLDRDWQVRQVIHHRGATAVVGHGGDAALGLVEQDIEIVEGGDGFAVDQHGVVVRIDLRAEHGDDLAVHLHATGDDQLLGLAACGDPGGREIPLQADRGGHRLPATPRPVRCVPPRPPHHRGRRRARPRRSRRHPSRRVPQADRDRRSPP